MNYAGFTKKFFEIVIVTLHPFGCCSTIKTYASHSFECLPLCCLTSLSSHCSVFKVQYFQPLLKPDLKIQIPLGFEIQQQTAVFCLVGLSGLEPPTLRLSVVRSSQLSYRPVLVLPASSRLAPSKLNNVTTSAPADQDVTAPFSDADFSLERR